MRSLKYSVVLPIYNEKDNLQQLFDEIFRGKIIDSALHHAASMRDGSLAVLVGIAARISIDEDRPVKIAELTDLEPQKNKWE